jgi:hypothetical protein
MVRYEVKLGRATENVELVLHGIGAFGLFGDESELALTA